MKSLIRNREPLRKASITVSVHEASLTEDLLQHKAYADFREIAIIELHSFLNNVQKLSMSSWIFDKITTSCLTNDAHREIYNQESSLWVLVIDSFCCNIIVSVRYTKITEVNLSHLLTVS